MPLLPVTKQRRFIDKNQKIISKDDVVKYFTALQERKINSNTDLEQWLRDRSELEAFIYEEGGWRYIRMTIDTTNEKNATEYNFFVSEIEPVIAPLANALNKKFLAELEKFPISKKEYSIYTRAVRSEIELFREENVELNVKATQEAQKFSTVAGAQTVNYKGESLTLPRAALFLKSNDREERRLVFELISKRRSDDKEQLNEIFDQLVNIRHQIATNAGFKNYRDYKFRELGRFDYGVKECLDMHNSIRNEIVPLVKTFLQERKEKLGYEKLRPWDLEVDISGNNPLKPFSNASELTKKTIHVFQKLHNYFGDCIETMQHMGHFDLESKPGKAPGGYNYPLYETGVPFIFMNAVGTQRDMVTMVHEGGHAVHSFLSKDLELTGFKSLPSEVAELASMGMELISMDHWNEYYADEAELKRAKKDQLEKIISILPWIAIVDKFQHWVYENPQHTREERKNRWKEITEEFSTHTVDYTGYEWTQEDSWQRQLHIFEVPFYYIEYAMAQLGAIALWRNFKKNKQLTVMQYMQALALGYTQPIPEIYKTAGIEFNFSGEYIKELVSFVKGEYDSLK